MKWQCPLGIVVRHGFALLSNMRSQFSSLLALSQALHGGVPVGLELTVETNDDGSVTLWLEEAHAQTSEG